VVPISCAHLPTVAVIDATGFTLLDDDAVAARAEALYGGREEGSAS